ncbi:MAG: hypothetical protein AB8G96_14985 [Phycisphaerales bacterium]
MPARPSYLATCVLFVASLLTGSAFAGGGFTLTASTIDAGGGFSADATYTLVGTVGQPDAGVHFAPGYTLIGGFHAEPQPAAPICPGDFNDSGDVDVPDLVFLLAFWNTDGADLNGDGTTDTTDLIALLAVWGPCPS